MAMISRAPDSGIPMSRQYSPQRMSVCVSGSQCSMRSSFACSCCSACSCRTFSSRLARFSVPICSCRAAFSALRRSISCCCRLTREVPIIAPIPSTMFDPTSAAAFFNLAPFSSPFTLFSSASVRFSSALFCAWSVAVCSYSVRTCRSCCLSCSTAFRFCSSRRSSASMFSCRSCCWAMVCR